MNEITVGVLTISDRCARREAVDESGPRLMESIGEGIIRGGRVVKSEVVADSREEIERVLREWCGEGVDVVLTTGGTGVSERDVTPEATAAVLEKSVPGIPLLMFQRSSAVTPLAALSRGVAGVRGRSLIINFPGSKKASTECLEAVAKVIPHAVDLIKGRKENVEKVHAGLKKRSLVVAGGAGSRQRKSPYPCISVAEAEEILMGRVSALAKKRIDVSLEQAFGHVLCEDVLARDNLPPFDVSLMDGYAVRSDSVRAERTLLGVCNMGERVPVVGVDHETCMRVSTGAGIPPGADCVVMVEDTEVVSLHEKEEYKIRLLKFPSSRSNIRDMGSDYRKGEVVLKGGTVLCPAGVGLLASVGVTSVKVFSRPKVAVMSTGNELKDPYVELTEGTVRDSNRIMIMNLLREENVEVVDLGITADEPDLLRESLEKGFRAADVVVTTGSMSMGERDYLKEVIKTDFGGEICFGRVKMKPGKPTAFGVIPFEGDSKLWFGFPGNPASAFVASHLYLLPALREIAGKQETVPKRLKVKVKLRDPEDRPQYTRGILTYHSDRNTWSVLETTSLQRSSWVGSCVNANCLIVHPDNSVPAHAKNRDDYLADVLLIGKVAFT